jgi:hypothetical protein
LKISFLTLQDEAKIGRRFDLYDEDMRGIYVDEEEDNEVDSLTHCDSRELRDNFEYCVGREQCVEKPVPRPAAKIEHAVRSRDVHCVETQCPENIWRRRIRLQSSTDKPCVTIPCNDTR